MIQTTLIIISLLKIYGSDVIELFLMTYLFGVLCGIIFVILATMGYCKFGNKIVMEYQNGIQEW